MENIKSDTIMRDAISDTSSADASGDSNEN